MPHLIMEKSFRIQDIKMNMKIWIGKTDQMSVAVQCRAVTVLPQDYPSLGHINHVAKQHSVNLVWAVTGDHFDLYR